SNQEYLEARSDSLSSWQQDQDQSATDADNSPEIVEINEEPEFVNYEHLNVLPNSPGTEIRQTRQSESKAVLFEPLLNHSESRNDKGETSTIEDPSEEQSWNYQGYDESQLHEMTLKHRKEEHEAVMKKIEMESTFAKIEHKMKTEILEEKKQVLRLKKELLLIQIREKRS